MAIIITKNNKIPNLKNFYNCIRVYNNGEEVKSKISSSDLYDYISYNISYRFGCALFIDGICVYSGYLTKERCKNLEQKYK